MPKRVSRRELLAGAAGAAGAMGAAALPSARGAAAAQGLDTTRVPGAAASARGARSPHETVVRDARFGLASRTPLQDLHGTITPSDLHFERHHAGIPAVDPGDYQLLVHGMVERPTIFTLADLKRFPATSRICFLECSGNYPTNAGPETRPEIVCGMTSTTEWTGVALATLFREVGASPDATWFLAEGQDAAVMTRSIPMEKAWDDALVAYAQNGEAVRPAQGYPARLLLPGWEGNSNVKWLRRIELADRPFMTREETSKYTDPLADGTARQFSFVFDARSIITAPAYPDVVEPGWIEIRGIAWSGRGNHRARRRQHGRGTHLAGGAPPGAGAAAGAHPLPPPLALGRRGDRDHEPRGGRHRLRAADAGGAAGRTRAPGPALPPEPHHRLARPDRRAGRVPGGGSMGRLTAPDVRGARRRPARRPGVSRPGSYRCGRAALALAAALAAGWTGPALTSAAAAQAAGGGAEEARAAAGTEAQPERFGFGRPATREEIAAWDLDVRPDGAGLPAGEGTAASGAPVYAAQCAVCHGPAGEGGIADRLVGYDPASTPPFGPRYEAWRGNGPDVPFSVGNYWPYATTLYDYILRAMPSDSPGTLTPDEVYGLVAWILARNGIIAQDAVMNAVTLPAVEMPARDIFVPQAR